MEDIFIRLSSSVDRSLPKFVNDRFSHESRQLLELINTSWESRTWYDMLVRVERYLEYTIGDISVIADGCIETLIDIAKKLWYISTFNTLNENKALGELYVGSSELKHIGFDEKKMTLRVKSFSMKLLNSILDNFLAQLPSIWESDYDCLYDDVNKRLYFIRIEVILTEFRSYFNRDYTSSIATSLLKKTEWINSIVTLSGIMRHIWLFRDDIGKKLLEDIFGNRLEIDTGTTEVFLQFRLVALLCPNITIYNCLIDGTIFKWWDLINGDRVPTWNPLICTLLFRAVKFGWATGKPLYSTISSKIPQLFNILYLSFNIPNRVSSSKIKEKTPNLYTLLSDKRVKICKKLAKILVLLMPPKLDYMKPREHDIFDYITALVNTIYPYTHPSNNGKWTTNIARFTKNFIASYARRVCRERTFNRIRVGCGMSNNGNESVDYKLNNNNDKFIADLFYSLALQGLHSRHPQVSNAYEDAIKRLCYIQPDPLLNIIVDHMITACDSVTEPHQVIMAVRIFYHLSALIIKYMPEALLSILDVTLKGIDTSDPFKTGQILILVNVIFSQIPCMDLSNIELSYEEKCRCFQLCYSKGLSENTDNDFVKEINSLRLDALENVQGGFFSSNIPVQSEANDDLTHLKMMRKLENCTSLDDAINLLDIILAQRRHVSQHFPIWCLNWFDALLKFVSQLTKPNMTPNSLMNTLDIGTFVLLRSAVVTILSQVDAGTATEVYTLFYKWVINNTSRKDPLKHMTAIASCLSYSNPETATTCVLKPLLARLKHELEADSDLVSNQIGEDRLIWYISCISGLVRFSNVRILPYINDILYVSNIGMKHKSKSVFKSCTKLISRAIYSLIGVYFVDSKSTSEIFYNDENMNHAFILWDVPWFAKNFSKECFDDSNRLNLDKLCHIDWHIAKDDELSAVKRLFSWLISRILSLSHDILSDINVPSFVTESDCLSFDHTLSLFNRINRICILCKYILKGLKDFAVDDRSFDAYGLPLVTPIDFTPVFDLQNFVKSVILSIIEKYGAFSDSKDDLTVTNILMKLLKLINLYIVRNAHSNDENINDKGIIYALKNNCNVGITVTASRSMISSLSYYYGLNRLSFWQDVPRGGWLSIVYDRYQSRLNLRKFDHESTNERIKMLEIVLSCATCHYKQLSSLARGILKDFVLVHRDVRNIIIDYTLDKGLSLVPKSNSDSYESEALATIPEIFEISLIERILSCSNLFSKFVEFICSVVSTASNNGNLMIKYDSLFVLFLNTREEYMVDYDSNVPNNILDSLSGGISINKQGLLHWRFQLYCTAILVSFSFCISKENIGRYIDWLIEACDHTSKHVCVLNAAMVGLFPFFVGKVSSYSTKLMDEKAVHRILMAIPFVNHDSIRQSAAPSQDVSNTLISIITSSIARAGKPWPNNRISSNSNNHSTYNFIFCYGYFQFLFSNNSINNLGTVTSVLDYLSQSPQSYPENHIGFFEISCSLMRASLLLPLEEKTTLWESLYPLVRREIETVTLDRISDFMDSFRLTLDGYKLDDHDLYTPIFNLVLDNDTTSNILQMSEFSTLDDNDTTGYNLQVVKRLRLLQAILQQLNKIGIIIEILLPAILSESALFNSSQQIRNEISHLCSLVVSICCNGPSEFMIYKERIHSRISDFIKDTEPRITFAEDDCSRIKGLLSVISLLFSSSMPMIDLDHEYISLFLGFALKLSRHTNDKINRLATKAISNIAMSYYYIKDYKRALNSIESTLVKMSKVPQYKVRLCAIHAAEILQRNLCMYIRNTKIAESLLNLYISSLQDTQTRDSARDALSAIAISANDETYLYLTQRFFQLVKENEDISSVSSGVSGLAALVSTAPYHVPSWMPHTLTTLASCASPKFPISIRNIVQRTLQEFFKSHIDAWSQIHIYKFTRQQLDILHMYKGCPIYFN
ncbi:hypothetical protein BEWA_007190 [Theileria equi strain WA]|uniref:Proteasome activator complex subunit 4 C-terminal domain-containing protein n=1 Tax=Theileria equi strain WA TaxID=1537102 RepID=L0B0G8_THEEQ|nr:hypothetical protein BEWA_007190 [Theileria equi strain WA]AFZ81310.1 hypothetical protein BEWA_007190 [Theileria equi strain WA]|eukprot:XP_004830976.1 hypothetical protein BEWA_007190 [Theileria equi strain WA]